MAYLRDRTELFLFVASTVLLRGGVPDLFSWMWPTLWRPAIS